MDTERVLFLCFCIGMLLISFGLSGLLLTKESKIESLSRRVAHLEDEVASYD